VIVHFVRLEILLRSENFKNDKETSNQLIFSLEFKLFSVKISANPTYAAGLLGVLQKTMAFG
jgi:hypothetical protein